MMGKWKVCFDAHPALTRWVGPDITQVLLRERICCCAENWSSIELWDSDWGAVNRCRKMAA